MARTSFSAVTLRTLLAYLAGNRMAILQVASSSAALPTGVLLVLITSLPRNYDQLFIAEHRGLWLLGPLAFSLVSGSFVFLGTYQLFIRRNLALLTPRPSGWSQWRSFMGLFWCTAPIAWLYAIPVERWLDSLSAAKANLFLLGIVSLWRVVLMARVIGVVSGAGFVRGLVWVLVPASAEVVLLVIFGGGMANAIARGMGGLRHSPEEELLLRVISPIFQAALPGFLLFLILGFYLAGRRAFAPFPTLKPGAMPWAFLAGTAAFWILVTIPVQSSLRHNVAVERLVAGNDFRGALDYLSAHSPSDFAPTRPLPPKVFEYRVMEELPGLWANVRTNDPVWVQELLLARLRQMWTHFDRMPGRRDPNWVASQEEQLNVVIENMSHRGPDAVVWAQFMEGLQRVPGGRAWLDTNLVLWESLEKFAVAPDFGRGFRRSPGELQEAWKTLDAMLATRRSTNQLATPTP